MTESFNTIITALQFPFVRYALIVGILVALCSSLLGVTLVLRRFSLISTGLAHVAFCATAIASALQLTDRIDSILFVLVATVICAVLILRTGRNTKIKGDASIAMITVGTLAIGYLIMNIFPRSANLAGDICTIMFGAQSIITLRMADVWVSIGLSVLVTAVFVLFYNKIFALTFDEDFAEATGNKAKLYNLLLAVVIAIVIVLAMNLIGALMVSALVIFPALSAMRVFKSFKSVTICAVIFSITCIIIGMLLSIAADTPVGATIVAVDIAGFAVFSLIGFLRGKVSV